MGGPKWRTGGPQNEKYGILKDEEDIEKKKTKPKKKSAMIDTYAQMMCEEIINFEERVFFDIFWTIENLSFF